LLLNNTKHLEKDVFYDLLHNWLGQGLLTSKGVEWHKRRKILTPAFHFSILQEFAEVFNKEVRLLVEDIKKSCSKPYIDVVKPISEFTLYSIGETSLGKDLRDDPKCDEYKQAVYDYGDHYMYRMIRPWLHGSFLFNLTEVGKKAQKTCEVLHDFSNNIIRERYETLQKGADAQFAKKRLALLDLMIKAKYNGASIDDLGIREEVDTFILAGHDTTAVALGHILMLLANEQEAQVRFAIGKIYIL
uniref:Cytochrome P450 4C1-like n=1 Tax=Diabrotica virgifera virgifera TaxID=50390 RepID=A0A6P7GGD6_DIAVI